MAVETTHEQRDDKLETCQYKVIVFGRDHRGEIPEEILNSFGHQGWELVAISYELIYGETAYLKRITHAGA